MNAILEYKDDIFLYIQQYYRFFMKRKSVSEIPGYSIRFLKLTIALEY